MSLSVHFANPLDAVAVSQLHTLLDDGIAITQGPELPEPLHYNVLVTGRPSREQLEASPALRMLVIPFAGMPTTTRDLMRQYPQIAIHNLHHNAAPTAEMALALLMAAARQLMPAERAFRQHDWTPRYEQMPQVVLSGKTALILGYGAIGQHLGTILRAMGMTVLGTRRRNTNEAEGIYPPDALHDLLPRAQVLVIALPQTAETEGLIGTQELSLLPEGAILVNIGRGAIVQQQALYNALKRRHLHAAAADVWYNYPTDAASRTNTAPADVPFHELDNMVMSPHRAGAFGNADVELLRAEALAKIFNAAARDEVVPNRVSLDVGY